MKSFDDSWKENRHVFESTKNLAKAMYLDGQQSRQAEVDELQKRVKELELINFDSELHFDAAKEHIDRLQDRINEALKFLRLAYHESCGYRVDEAINILKGEQTK